VSNEGNVMYDPLMSTPHHIQRRETKEFL